MDQDWIIWLLFSVCLTVSVLLSGMEAGVFALNRVRIRQLMRSGRRNAAVLHGYLEHPEDFLWTIVVGNTLANFLILGWLAVLLHRSFIHHPGWFALVYALLVVLFFMFCDLLPKTLFRLYPNRLCMLAVRPFRLLHQLLRPLVVLVEAVSFLLLRWTGGHAFTGRLFGNREELRFLMQESSQALSSDEKVLINRVLDFQTATVRQAMKPMRDVVTVDSNTTVGAALALCRERRFSRLPVWGARGGRPKIIGLLSSSHLVFQPELKLAQSVDAFVRPALFVNEDMRLENLLRRMQRSGQRLAIVLGRDHREQGIVSLQDVLRVIFGEVSL